MNIVRLKIKNFMSISDVEIAPGKINQICGGNSNGKTTILKAIEFAIKGSADGSLVKFGEDSAEVYVELMDGTNIKRKLNSFGKQTVDVKKDEFKVSSPQTYLEQLFDYSALNPLELLDPKKRTDAILKSLDIKLTDELLASHLNIDKAELPPLDYSQHGLKVLDQCHKYFYQRRAEANKDADDKKRRWETYKSDFKEPESPKMVRKEIELRRESCNQIILQTQQRIDSIKKTHEAAKVAQEKLDRYSKAQVEIETKIKTLTANISNVDKELETIVADMRRDLEQRITHLKDYSNKKMTELKQELSTEEGRLSASQSFINDAKTEVPTVLQSTDEYVKDQAETRIELGQLDTAEKEIEAYEATQKQKDMIVGMENEFQVAAAFSEKLTNLVDLLRTKVKEEIMASVKMPLEGLQYTDGNFNVHGCPIDNLSTSQSVKLAVGVARSLAKKTKIISLDGIECLDENTWDEFRKETQDDGFTYFVSVVGKGFDTDDKKIKMENGVAIQ